MQTAPSPMPHFAVDSSTTPDEVVALGFYDHQLRGGHRRCLTMSFETAADAAALLPAGSEIQRHWSATTRADDDAVAAMVPRRMRRAFRPSSGERSVIYATLGDAALLARSGTTRVTVHVSAPSDELATQVAAQVAACAPEPDVAEGSVDYTVWHHNGNFADDSRLSMPELDWQGIRANYPDRVAGSLDALMAAHHPSGGKLVLWHGAPGTGKTTALRALVSAWSEWCDPHYVADPERLFANPSYLTEVAGGRDEKRWRLVIAEDSDEFLRSSARQEAGAALGRLLNFTDGFLGQASNTLVLMTTNEPISSLHPAVVRPGRCLAEIEFLAFTEAQARAWLPSGVAAPSGGATLAQLLELRGDLGRLDTSRSETTEVGMYL